MTTDEKASTLHEKIKQADQAIAEMNDRIGYLRCVSVAIEAMSRLTVLFATLSLTR